MTYQETKNSSSHIVLPPEIVNTIDKAVFSSRSLRDVLFIILDAALELLHAKYGSLRQVDRINEVLVLSAYRLQSGKSISPESKRDLSISGDSIMASVARTGQPELLKDINHTLPEAAQYHKIGPNLNIRSELAVPLLSDDGTVVTGVLNVESPHPNAFTEEDQKRLVMLASRAQVAIQRTMLADKIYEISQKVLTTSLQELLDYIVEAVSDLIQVPVCTIWLLDEKSGKLMEEAAIGRDKPREGDLDYQIGDDSFIGQVLKTKQPVVSLNVRNESKFIHTELAEALKLTSALVIPILSPDEEILGAIALYSVGHERSFTEHDQQLSLSFASKVAIRLEQARLAQQEEQNLQITACLRKVGDALAKAPNLYGLLQSILQEAMALLDGSGAILYFHDVLEQANKIVAAAGTVRKVEGMIVQPDESIGGWVIKYNQAVHCAIKDPRVDQNVAQDTDAVNIVAVPLVAEGAALGSLIILDHKDKVHQFNAQDAERLTILAPHATAAINRMRHYEQTKRNSAQLEVINSVLIQSVKTATPDIDSLLQRTALAIHNTFGYRVDIGIKQADHLLYKIIAPYHGQQDSQPWTAPFNKGISGAALSTRKYVVLNDVREDSRYYAMAPETLSELAIPLLLANREPIGVLNIESQELNTFADPETQRMFDSIAATLTIAIENARRLKELEVLNDITTTVNTVQNLSQMAEVIVKKVIELFDAQGGRLFLADADGKALKLIYYSGADDLAKRTEFLDIGKSIAGKVLEGRKTIFSRNMIDDPRADGVATLEDGICSLIDVPIWADNKLLGVLAILSKEERVYTQLDIEILEAIGKNIGSAVERAYLNERSHSLYKNAPDPILILDRKGIISDANPATMQLTGYTLHELQGYNVFDFISNNNTRNQVKARIQRMAKGEQLDMMEITVRCSNGEELFIESNPTIVKNDNGGFSYIQAHWRDITPRKRQEEFLRELAKRSRKHQFDKERLLSDMTQHVIQVMQSDDCYIHLIRDESDLLEPFVYPQSPYINQICDYPLKIGEGIVGTVAKSGRRKRMKNIQDKKAYKFIPFIPRNMRQDIVAVPMRTKDGIIGVLSVLRYGDNIELYSKADSDRLEGLADTLTLALENRRLNREQSRQLAAQTVLKQMNVISMFVTHRLGNLIPAMNFSIRELRHHLDTSIPKIEELMGVLEEGGERAMRTINCFRDMGLPLNQESIPIYLPSVIENSLAEVLKPATNIKIISDDITNLPHVLAQEGLLIEIVQGVINNAIEAMGKEGQLSISGTCSRDQREVRLRFTNTGPGIPKEHQEKIFEPFFTTKRERSGIGLGLWLSRLYLQSIGGDIEIYSKSENGASVTLHLRATQHDLPVQSSESATETDTVKPFQLNSTFNAKRILVIDDDPYFQRSLHYPLQRYGFTVYTAKTKQEAEKFLKNAFFDAYLVDIRLIDYDRENIDGMDLVDQIRQHDKKTPILLISAYPKTVEQAKNRFKNSNNITILTKTDSRLEEALQQLAEQNRKEDNDHEKKATGENSDSGRRARLANHTEVFTRTSQF